MQNALRTQYDYAVQVYQHNDTIALRGFPYRFLNQSYFKVNLTHRGNWVYMSPAGFVLYTTADGHPAICKDDGGWHDTCRGFDRFLVKSIMQLSDSLSCLRYWVKPAPASVTSVTSNPEQGENAVKVDSSGSEVGSRSASRGASSGLTPEGGSRARSTSGSRTPQPGRNRSGVGDGFTPEMSNRAPSGSRTPDQRLSTTRQADGHLKNEPAEAHADRLPGQGSSSAAQISVALAQSTRTGLLERSMQAVGQGSSGAAKVSAQSSRRSALAAPKQVAPMKKSHIKKCAKKSAGTVNKSADPMQADPKNPAVEANGEVFHFKPGISSEAPPVTADERAQASAVVGALAHKVRGLKGSHDKGLFYAAVHKWFPVWAASKGQRFEIRSGNISDAKIAWELLGELSYVPKHSKQPEFNKLVLQPSDSVLDLGSNVGLYLVYAVAVLSRVQQWSNVRRLQMELSVDQLRQKYPNGEGFETFVVILAALKEGGFQLALADTVEIYNPEYWKINAYRKGFDNNLWFWRPVPPEVPCQSPPEQLMLWQKPRDAWLLIEADRYLKKNYY